MYENAEDIWNGATLWETWKKKLDVYQVGCLGKIINFNETSDNRFFINLSGIIRFKINKELETDKLYRKFNVDYSSFLGDLDITNYKATEIEKENILKKIKFFFNKINYSVEYNELAKLDFDQLVSTVCMISPFSKEEKHNLSITANKLNNGFIDNEIIIVPKNIKNKGLFERFFNFFG